MKSTDISAVDLFCGVGGLTNGLMKSGISVNAGFDIDNSCEYQFEENNHTRFISADISKISAKDVARYYPDGHIKVLAGCAPCQPFSAYSQRYDKKPDDLRWSLVESFARIIRGVKPDIVSMENVPLLERHAPFAALLRTLEKMKYEVNPQRVVHCESYGVPQKKDNRLPAILLI